MTSQFNDLPPADAEHPLIQRIGGNPAPARVRADGDSLVVAVHDASRRQCGTVRIALDGTERFEPVGEAPPGARASFGGDRSRIVVVGSVAEAMRLAAVGGGTFVGPARPEQIGVVAGELAKRFGSLVEIGTAPGEQPVREVQAVTAMVATAVGAEPLSVVSLDEVRGRRRRKTSAERADDGDAIPPPPEAGPDGKPVILIVAGRLPEMADEAGELLADPAAGIFRRGPQIVRPVRWTPPPPTLATPSRRRSLVRAEGAIILAPVDEPALTDVLGRRATWFKFDGRAREWTRRDCPPAVATTILARRGDGWRMPPIRGVIRCPTLRADGSVLNRPGYDPDSELLFATELDWPDVPAKPSREQSAAALDQLDDLLRDFPFVSLTDRAAALAALLTPVIRPALETAPLFAISAPAAGTGKSLIVEVASTLANGVSPTIIPGGGADEAELEKRINAALLGGDPIVSLDNINGLLRSDTLCIGLTQPCMSVRPLGSSASIEVPNAGTWYATGNNIGIIEDLRRRTVLCRLDARCENPGDRSFDRDVVGYAHSHRVQLVTAALTVIRGWLAAYIPPAKTMGSFESWSDTVRHALIWLGRGDPLGNASVMADNDPVRERAATIFRALAGLHQSRFTVADVAHYLPDNRELADALHEFVDQRRTLDAKKFGWFLRRHRDQNIGGLTLRQVEKVKDVARWQVS